MIVLYRRCNAVQREKFRHIMAYALLGNYLYTVGVPSAFIAIVTPSWTALPFMNFMNLHSFTVHMCLTVYPLMVTLGGDIQPHPKYLLHCIGLPPVWRCLCI